ncbi:hypothetical protein ACQ1ZK_16690, partial [Enterococcus faecium]
RPRHAPVRPATRRGTGRPPARRPRPRSSGPRCPASVADGADSRSGGARRQGVLCRSARTVPNRRRSNAGAQR